MGLISKIEDKLSGSDKHEEQKLEKQGMSSGQHDSSQYGSSQYGSNQYSQGSGATQSGMSGGKSSELQHPIQSATGKGSGIVGGTAVTGGAGSEAFNPTQSYGREGNVSSTSDQLRDTHLGSSTGPEGPRQPYNPYSSKGQQIAANAQSTNTYGASQGRAEAGDYGSRRSADDPEVRRTHHGGVSNQMTEGQNFNTGPHSHLENRDAVPTAGGHKVGSGTTSSMPGSYDNYESTPSTTQSSHHYGRDAALAGGAGAAGYGAYEATHGRGDTGPAPNTAGPHKSDMLNKLDPRVEAKSHQDHYGADTDKYDRTGRTTADGTTVYSSNHPSHGQSSIDRRQYDTTSAGTTGTTGTSTTSAGRYGQDVSYMNRPAADQPLTQSKDFSDRHPHSSALGAAGAGAGAGALGASALSHRHGDVSDSRNVSGSTYADQTTSPSTTQTTSRHGGTQYGSTTTPSTTQTSSGYGSSTTGGVVGGMGQSTSSATSGSDDHAMRGSEMAKRMGGAYEAGYKDGYRDAMAHRAAQV